MLQKQASAAAAGMSLATSHPQTHRQAYSRKGEGGASNAVLTCGNQDGQAGLCHATMGRLLRQSAQLPQGLYSCLASGAGASAEASAGASGGASAGALAEAFAGASAGTCREKVEATCCKCTCACKKQDQV